MDLNAGSRILEILKQKHYFYILAKCPINLESNKWYQKQGFKLSSVENGKLNIWVLSK